VFFHWANKDQHYIKTGENFRDYTFKIEGLGTEYRIRFVLSHATTPRGNTKGEYRYFFPQPEQMTFDKETHTLILPFEYRLPTEEDVQEYGTNTKGQDAILIEAAPKVMEAIPDDMLRDLLGEIVCRTDKENVSFLLKRLRHFTRKNTTDYFIHKNLEGFLKQELEFYIKDQMLHLADLEADFDQKRLTLRVFRHLADTIVTFLSQIEEVQKRLFEKKKFVLETNYCMTLDRIPEELYPEIAANDAQREEWVRLFAIDEIKGNMIVPAYSDPLTVEFLKANLFLVLNTKLFAHGFKDKLMAGFEDLDNQCDGILVDSENWQALNLLKKRYHRAVKCIYLDPPYNTGQDDFLYKDRYQNSSWLTFMASRVSLAHDMLSDKGAIFISIDDIEAHNLRILLNDIFGELNFIDTIIWKKRYGGGAKEKYLVSLHEYVIFFAKNETQFENIFISLDPNSINKYYKSRDEKYRIRGPYRTHPLEATKSVGVRPNLIYPIIAPDGAEIWPERQWWWDEKRTREALLNNELEFINGKKGWVVHTKQYLKDENGVERQTKAFSIIDSVYTQHGTSEIADLFSDSRVYSFPKPSVLIGQLVEMTQIGSDDFTLDFFAGSGPTAHAIINLNREDGGNRKYILVEMADYFDTVLTPRIKKVIYSKDWKNGKPVSREGISHMFKYIRLESYEDALHNLVSDGTLARVKSREEAYKKAKGEKEYCIRYLAKLPMEAGDTMLNLTRLEHPFDYTLEILTDDGPREQPVDLVETFNLLYGLSVRKLELWTDGKGGRSYRIVKAANRDGLKRILVVWRDMSGLDPIKEREFLEEMLEKEDEFDEKLINGDTATPGFQSLDRLFKMLMEAGQP